MPALPQAEPARRHNPQPVWQAARALAGRGPAAGGPAATVAARYEAARAEIEAGGPPELRELLRQTDAKIARWGEGWSECERNSRRRTVLQLWDACRPESKSSNGEADMADVAHEGSGEVLRTAGSPAGPADGGVLRTAGSPADGIDLVVPLGTGSRHGDGELRMLLRSARANLRGLRLVHVIGPRRPAWLAEHPQVRWHPWVQLKAKNHDIIAKFVAAAGMPEVSETFVAGSDDFLFLAPGTPGTDWGAVAQGVLSSDIRSTYWKRCQAATRRVLEQAGKPALYYDLHTPTVCTKAGWLQVEHEAKWRSQVDHAVWSLYHNVAGTVGPVLGAEVTCGWHAGDGSARPRNLQEIELATAGKLFAKYNDGGLNKAMLEWLAAKFPEPAPWEGPADGGNGPGAAGKVARPGAAPAKPLGAPRPAPAGLGKVTVVTPPGAFQVAVSVSCHPPYLPLLRACLTSIDRQTLAPVSRLLCLDSVAEVPEWLPREFAHWRLERGDWHSPNPQRNLGWLSARAPWVWYMDADNAAHPEYLAGAAAKVADHVGIVHADLAYTNGRRLPTPDGLDYWGLRLHNYVDTAAVWRRDAIREAGGWRPTERWDDWDLALRVTAAGWHTVRNSVPILFTVHPKGTEHRNAHGVDLVHKWGRSYGIVSLLAGRKGCWPKWQDAFAGQEFPERCTVYLVDDSRSAEFAAEIARFRARLEERGLQVEVFRPRIVAEEDTGPWGRHRRVCRLYNAVMPRVAEDVVWTWEDDNLPRTPDAGRQLCAHWQHTDVGGICAMYETRNHPGLICGSPGKDHWGPLKALNACRGKRQDGWGFIPGGFALFHTPLVLAAMPFAVSFPNGKGDSWDGKLSRAVRAAGFRLDLDGSVEVDHLFREG